jgi:hypothetical protein
MAYIDLINRFWELDRDWLFSGHETRLYFLLLNKANRLDWKENPRLDTGSAMLSLGVSDKQVVRKAQARLKEAGLIDIITKPGRGNKTEYLILPAGKTRAKRADKRVGKRVETTSLLPTNKTTLLEKRVAKREENPTLLHLIDYNKTKDYYYDDYINNNGDKNSAENIEKNEGKTPTGILEVEEAVKALRTDSIWREAECMKHRVGQSEIDSLLGQFPAHCRAMGEELKTLQRFKFHFDNWLRKQKYQSSTTNRNETNREDRLSRRRGVDPSALRPEDFT